MINLNVWLAWHGRVVYPDRSALVVISFLPRRRVRADSQEERPHVIGERRADAQIRRLGRATRSYREPHLVAYMHVQTPLKLGPDAEVHPIPGEQGLDWAKRHGLRSGTPKARRPNSEVVRLRHD